MTHYDRITLPCNDCGEETITFDLEPEEWQTWDHPGCPPSATPTVDACPKCGSTDLPSEDQAIYAADERYEAARDAAAEAAAEARYERMREGD